MRFLLVIALFAVLLSEVAQAGEIRLKQSFSGNIHPTMVDVNSDGITAGAGTFYAHGSPGRAVINSFAESTGFAPFGVPGCDLRSEIVYQNFVETFNDGSMIFFETTEGFVCVDLVTSETNGELEGIITGGTGRFDGASGAWAIAFEAFVVGGGITAVPGTMEGTILLSE